MKATKSLTAGGYALAAAMNLASACAPLHAQTDQPRSTTDDASPPQEAESAAAEAPESLDTIPVAPEGTTTTEEPVSAVTGRSRLVEEIVVTAQKREENVQDVPISIAAFSSEQLDARGLQDTEDLGLVTPGLQFSELAGYSLIFLRGVGSDAFIPSADPGVTTYVDGVFIPTGHGFSTTFGGVERVEVAKGPQGTLFGRNSTGGAISVVLKKPGGEPETSIETSYTAEINEFRARAYTNIPLTDAFGFSVSALTSNQESLYERDAGPLHDSHLPREISRGGRLKINWSPLDTLSFDATAQHIELTGAGTLISAVETPSLLLGTLLAATGQPTSEAREYKTTIDTDPLVRTRHRLFYGSVSWELPWVDLKLLGSDQTILSQAAQYDFDATALPLVSFNSPNQFTDQQTVEFQILSNTNTPGSDWLRWVAGYYTLESSAGYDPLLLFVSRSAVRLPTDQLVELIPPQLVDLLSFVPGPDGITVVVEGVLGTKSESAFFQGTATLTDWLDITFGGRYQEEERQLEKATTNVENISDGLTTLLSFRRDRSKVDNFSPKVSLDFRVWDEGLLYASWARGFKSATYNIVNIYSPPDFVKPEEVTSIELGSKNTLFDGALRLNGAIFQTEIKDLQSVFVSLLAGGAVNFENAGKARVRGAEFDAIWAVMPESNPGLVLTAGASVLDTKYTSFTDGSGFNEQTGLFSDGNDFTGNKIPRTPDFSGNIGLSQTIEVNSGSVEIAADYYYNDGFFYTSQNIDINAEPSYDLVNARISYLHAPWGLRLTVFGNNLADTRYHLAKFHTDFGVADTYAAPRSYGLRLNWDF